MKNKDIITGVLGLVALGALSYVGYRNKDEIKKGVKKAGKVTKEKTAEAKKAVKDKSDTAKVAVLAKKDEVTTSVKEGKDKLAKKLDSSSDIVGLFKSFEQEFKNSVTGNKVSKKELEELQEHFSDFSLDPNTKSSVDFDDIVVDDYTIEREDYPNKVV